MKLTSLIFTALILSGCSSMSPREQNTAAGALVGGVAGAALTNGSVGGTVGGAVVGGFIGHEIDTNESSYRTYHQNNPHHGYYQDRN